MNEVTPDITPFALLLRIAALGSPAALALQASFDFRDAMLSLEKNAGISSEDLEAISKGILRLADFEEKQP